MAEWLDRAKHDRRAVVQRLAKDTIAELAEATGVRPDVIVGHRQTRGLSFVRRIAYRFLRDCGLSLCETAQALNRHHSTVMHALKTSPGVVERAVLLTIAKRLAR